MSLSKLCFRLIVHLVIYVLSLDDYYPFCRRLVQQHFGLQGGVMRASQSVRIKYEVVVPCYLRMKWRVAFDVAASPI